MIVVVIVVSSSGVASTDISITSLYALIFLVLFQVIQVRGGGRRGEEEEGVRQASKGGRV